MGHFLGGSKYYMTPVYNVIIQGENIVLGTGIFGIMWSTFHSLMYCKD